MRICGGFVRRFRWRKKGSGGFFCATIAEAVAAAVYEMFGMAMPVVGVAAVLLVEFSIAENFVQGVFGIRGVAFGAGFAALAYGVMDDLKGVAENFGRGVVLVPAARPVATWHD